MSKYRSIRTEVDGISFASKKESRRYSELKLLERANRISELRLQPRYKLEVFGELICTYVGDFEYADDEREQLVTEDVKGFETPEFKIKRKLFKAIYGRDVVLV